MILDDDILYSKPDPAELVLEHRGPKGWHVDDNGNWIDGTLDDNVHPTPKGAKLLYHRFLADLPELTSK